MNELACFRERGFRTGIASPWKDRCGRGGQRVSPDWPTFTTIFLFVALRPAGGVVSPAAAARAAPWPAALRVPGPLARL